MVYCQAFWLLTVFKNPWFIIACILFWINQFLEKILGIFIPYVHAYLDDLMAMPVVLGITLQVYRWIHPSKNQFVFSPGQVFVGFAYFSFLFEYLLPKWSDTYTADIWDIVCYAVGSIAFYMLINKKEIPLEAK
nr:magnesium citrate secondary transporter [Mongoliibacter sp.]